MTFDFGMPDPFEGSKDEFEDGTNITVGIPFREEFTTRVLPWYVPSEAKGTHNWTENLTKLRTRFDAFIDQHCATECFLVQVLFPQVGQVSINPPGVLPDRSHLSAGTGLHREAARLFGIKQPLSALFPIMNVRGDPFVGPDGKPAPFRLGLNRHISVYAIPDGLRPLPVPKLTELLGDGKSLLFQLPSEIAVKIWRNWQLGFSQRDSNYLWLEALFELAWQCERGSPFHAERYAWLDNSSVALIGKGLFPRLPHFISSTPGEFCSHENGYPRAFYSKITDVARASVAAIDEILGLETAEADRRVKNVLVSSNPVIVLVSVNEHETHALLDAFLGAGQTPVQVTKAGVTYNLLGTHGGCRIVHTICEMGAGGIGASQERTRQAIEHWHPSALIEVGIAFGMDETKQKIGDVLVSTMLQDYELGRLNENGVLTPRGPRPSCADTLVNRIRQTDVTGRRRTHDWPKLHFGLVLSGQKLVDNLDYRESLKELFPDAIGGEMEGSGVFVSATASKVDWIILKAICDWGFHKNHTEKDAWQRFAAKNAARVLKAVFDVNGLYDPRGTNVIREVETSPRMVQESREHSMSTISQQLCNTVSHLHTTVDIRESIFRILLHPDCPRWMSVSGKLVRNPIWDQISEERQKQMQNAHQLDGPSPPTLMHLDVLLIRRNDSRGWGELYTYYSRDWGTASRVRTGVGKSTLRGEPGAQAVRCGGPGESTGRGGVGDSLECGLA